MLRHKGVGGLALLMVVGGHAVVRAATVPSGFVDEAFVNVDFATAMEFAPDGRLFVCEQGGALRIAKNGSVLPTPAISLTVNSVGERGLLGIAFDPNFASTQFVYLYYTATSPTIHNRVSRFTLSGDVINAGTELPLLDLPTLNATNHNGGAIHFGNDGKLYVATGENAVPSNSQSLDTPLGKMLRINRDGTIPSDNPFFGSTTGINRAIWALGLRNPFTFDVQRTTGRVFINDVGEASWEEIDDGIVGSNYGWPTTEGPTTNPSFRSPLFAYQHLSGECAITGGAFYNPTTPKFPSGFVGDYFFADLCAGFIKSFDLTTGQVTGFATGVPAPVDLKVGADGALYYLFHGNPSVRGGVGRIRSTAPVAVPAFEWWGAILLGAALGCVAFRELAGIHGEGPVPGIARRSRTIRFA